MANVTINDNTKPVELVELNIGDYFILNGDLYLVKDMGNDYFMCFNLSDGESIRDIDCEIKVLSIPSDKVKIKVEI